MTSYQHPRRERMEISQEVLKEFLHYNPETGIFTRAKSTGPRQARRVGARCGSLNRISGYVEIHVLGRNRYAHRLAWIMANGSIPEGARIDHRNRDKSDNRICNLRLATQADNGRNCKVRVDNTSGIKGVYFDKSRGKWAAMVSHQKLGRFDTLLDAAAARHSAARATFGEFANERALA